MAVWRWRKIVQIKLSKIGWFKGWNDYKGIPIFLVLLLLLCVMSCSRSREQQASEPCAVWTTFFQSKSPNYEALLQVRVLHITMYKYKYQQYQISMYRLILLVCDDVIISEKHVSKVPQKLGMGAKSKTFIFDNHHRKRNVDVTKKKSRMIIASLPWILEFSI